MMAEVLITCCEEVNGTAVDVAVAQSPETHRKRPGRQFQQRRRLREKRRGTGVVRIEAPVEDDEAAPQLLLTRRPSFAKSADDITALQNEEALLPPAPDGVWFSTNDIHAVAESGLEEEDPVALLRKELDRERRSRELLQDIVVEKNIRIFQLEEDMATLRSQMDKLLRHSPDATPEPCPSACVSLH